LLLFFRKEDLSLKIYLAGPDVFLPNALDIGLRKKALCRQYGLTGLFPLDNTVPPDTEAADRQIYQNNVAMIEQADAGLFNLTPFRGPSADVGTVFELGMMVGLGKPVFGYSSTATDLRLRVPGAACRADGNWIDEQGCLVEDFGNADNLMIDASLAAHGGAFLLVDGSGRIDDMVAFSAGLAVAAGRLLAGRQGGEPVQDAAVSIAFFPPR
jgi:nucleoside 2-deoxyribosyltransferase